MTQNKVDVWKMFDGIAKSYDLINRVMTFGNDRRWRKKMCSFLPKQTNMKILDCATGTGDQIASFLKHGNISHAIGIDPAAKMLAVGKEKLKNYKNVELIEASAMNIPFEKESFDCVSISFGIRNMDNHVLCLQEMERVLKKGGRILLLEGSLPENAVCRQFHLLYLRHILPRIGGLLSKNKNAYIYLNKTIETFPYGKDFCTLMQKTGFSNVRSYPQMFGAVSIYVGDKL